MPQVYLAISEYSDSSTFGTTHGYHEILGVFEKFREAEEFLEKIKNLDKWILEEGIWYNKSIFEILQNYAYILDNYSESITGEPAFVAAVIFLSLSLMFNIDRSTIPLSFSEFITSAIWICPIFMFLIAFFGLIFFSIFHTTFHILLTFC